jgi:hypothetical protein
MPPSIHSLLFWLLYHAPTTSLKLVRHFDVSRRVELNISRLDLVLFCGEDPFLPLFSFHFVGEFSSPPLPLFPFLVTSPYLSTTMSPLSPH